ncbi:juvenile hormone esterase [Drosophila grimshawi]|uniref:Carboxylic ester hydrolase n=1 Tax=Drosophila grimshawi TaxID=7222 RepID=B4JCF1_DROGR|nr:juvenile hormone esterase [Drosophila grimshawi]EDW03105.1 GH10674 [Drosophila grimshawi]
MNCLLRQLVVVVVLLLVVLPSCSLEEIPSDSETLVSTSLGSIQGSTMKSFSGLTINAFRGVPYAEPPVGELRFQAPKPVRAWAPETLKATSDSLICPQTGVTLFMSEDCLKLNVYSKNLTGSLPVIVYIHGGANVLGSGHSLYEAGPQYLLEHDVVLVTFNYRLGALGFLGGSNNAYLDQVMALEWVHFHISKFGGNPDEVTLLGLSAGAMAVSLHLVSPLSASLFHRAILMSGSATNHFSIHNEFWSQLLARQVGCPLYDKYDMTECLRNVTWQRIVEVCATWEQYKFVNMKWNYEIDGIFLTQHPSVLIDKGLFNRVPLLVSFTTNELDFTTQEHLSKDLLLHDIITNFDDYAPELFLFDYDVQKSRRIKSFYLGENTNELNATNIEQFGKIFSDGIIGHGVYRLVDLARMYTNVYYTRMDYIGKRSVSVPLTEENVPRGVGHADDWQYVMPSLWYGTQFAQNHKDLFMMQRLTDWITHFAETGTPMLDADQHWPPCNAQQIQMLYNDEVAKLGPPAFDDYYAVWDELFPKPRGNGAAQSQLQLHVVVVIGVGLVALLFGNKCSH